MKLRVVRQASAPRRLWPAAHLLLLLAAPRSSHAACPPAAVVEGAAEITQSVSVILRQHGVGAGPSACGGPVIRAVLTRNTASAANSYWLHIVDGYGRASDRQVADPGDAASLIESWATAEDADLLLPPIQQILPTQSTLPAIAQAPGPPPPALNQRWHLSAAAELARASDGSTWYGGVASFCGRLGLACVGARTRMARNQERVSRFGDSNRTAIDGSILVATGLSRGRLTVAPLLAVGARWTHSTLALAPLTLSADDVRFQAEAATVVAWAFARQWAVVAEVGGAAGLISGGRGNARPPFFTLVGPIPPDPIPRPASADLHLALGIELRP